MEFFNPIEFLIQFEFTKYLLCAFGFYGLSLCVQKIVLGGNRV